ncbi:ARID/BRIGHT DNA binding domain protein, partial [Cooperia oncophora]
TLPNNWTAKEIYADGVPRKKETGKTSSAGKPPKKDDASETSKKEDDSKKKKAEKKVESDSSSSESSDEEEYGEERDLFVAQLYKFQEERGTPINRAPILGGKDIDLYRFYRVVQYYGGCKRVTTNQLWRKVLCKLHLEGCPGATPVTVRKAYIRSVLLLIVLPLRFLLFICFLLYLFCIFLPLFNLFSSLLLFS